MQLGFIGLGIMGRPMCRNLIKDGYKVKVYDIDSKAIEEFRNEDAEIAGSISEIAKSCSIIFIIVRNSDDVKKIVLMDNGLIMQAKKDTIIVDMSSILPSDSKYIAEIARKKGLWFLDAPVSGGEPKAIDGTLSFMVGGEENAYEKVHGILESMGKTIILIGNSGSGSMTKLVNQIIVNLNIAAVSEAFVLASKAGVKLEKVYEAIHNGLAGSTVLDAKFHMMLEHNFKPGGSLFINFKDIVNVMQVSLDLSVPMPFTAQLMEILKTFKNEGKLSYDHSAILEYFEKNAELKIGRE